MKLNRNVFREYDIRGKYGLEIDEDLFCHIGKALGTIYRKRNLSKIVLGMDCRLSSESLARELSNGLLSTGCNVAFVGHVPYPMIHFLTTTGGFEGGVYVTASHNTKEYNGVKQEYAGAEPIYGESIQEVANLIEKENYAVGAGAFSEENLEDLYVSFIAKCFRFRKKHRVVLNGGNGVAGGVALKILNKLNVEVVPVNVESDGSFPNGTPDTEDEGFMHQTSEAVKKHGVDAGFGLDGDGDRFLMVDEKGVPHTTDRSLLLFSKYILEQNPGSKIAYDVKCTSLAEEMIRKFGGEPIMMKTGRSLFIKMMTAKEALFGVEFSGHTYFADKYFGYDDGIYAICRTLEILDRERNSLSYLMSEFPKMVSSPEIKVPCSDDLKFSIVEKIVEQVTESNRFSKKSFIDGVRANVSDTGWFLIRAKNTSPFLGIRAEAADEEELKEVLNEVEALLLPYGLNLRG
ncbi:MAG: phosphomannomutase [Patescibacteria group bacterium]|nr:MAG: phosphomannomutase [Patescibacteria group bacterium]